MIFRHHEPVHLEERLVRRFAWFPIRIDRETIVWLERYWSVERFEYHQWVRKEARLLIGGT